MSGMEVDLLIEEEFWPSENSEEQRAGGSEGEIRWLRRWSIGTGWITTERRKKKVSVLTPPVASVGSS